MSERDIIFGPLLFGVLLNVLLSGIVISQYLNYCTIFKADPNWVKYYALVVFLGDTLDTITCMIILYYFFIKEPLQIQALGNFPFLNYPNRVLAVLLSFAIQIFFIYRFHRLRRSRWLTSCLGVVPILQIVAGFGVVAVGRNDALTYNPRWVVITWFALLVLADFLIAAALVYSLRDSRTGFQSTDDLLAKITRATVQTFLIPTWGAIVHLICFVVMNNNVHVLFGLISAKLYTTSFFYVLNCREHWNLSEGQQRTTILSDFVVQPVHVDSNDQMQVLSPSVIISMSKVQEDDRLDVGAGQSC